MKRVIAKMKELEDRILELEKANGIVSKKPEKPEEKVEPSAIEPSVEPQPEGQEEKTE